MKRFTLVKLKYGEIRHSKSEKVMVPPLEEDKHEKFHFQSVQ